MSFSSILSLKITDTKKAQKLDHKFGANITSKSTCIVPMFYLYQWNPYKWFRSFSKLKSCYTLDNIFVNFDREIQISKFFLDYDEDGNGSLEESELMKIDESWGDSEGFNGKKYTLIAIYSSFLFNMNLDEVNVI